MSILELRELYQAMLTAFRYSLDEEASNYDLTLEEICEESCDYSQLPPSVQNLLIRVNLLVGFVDNLDNTIHPSKLIESARLLLANEPRSREASIAITNLETAELWLTKLPEVK